MFEFCALIVQLFFCAIFQVIPTYRFSVQKPFACETLFESIWTRCAIFILHPEFGITRIAGLRYRAVGKVTAVASATRVFISLAISLAVLHRIGSRLPMSVQHVILRLSNQWFFLFPWPPPRPGPFQAHPEAS